MPKSSKISLEFDILIEEDKLANLETICNFRFDHVMAIKFLKKIPSTSDSFNSKGAFSHVDLEEIRETHLKYPNKMIDPQLLISKMTLLTELNQSVQLKSVNADRKEDNRVNNTAIIEYRLSSFEYRLFPNLSPLSSKHNTTI